VADSVEEVVYTWLQAETELTTAFSGMYWMEAQDTTYPYLVYWLVDDNGNKAWINGRKQGEARIQLDVWDSNRIRGIRNRALVREKVDDLAEVVAGFLLTTIGVSEQTIPRESATDPYHFVVDCVIRWKEI